MRERQIHLGDEVVISALGPTLLRYEYVSEVPELEPTLAVRDAVAYRDEVIASLQERAAANDRYIEKLEMKLGSVLSGQARDQAEGIARMTEVTKFVLEDFPELTAAERELLESDDYALSKLRDRFLDACGWNESAEVAVSAWRTWLHVYRIEKDEPAKR